LNIGTFYYNHQKFETLRACLPKADLRPRQSLNLSLRIPHLPRHFDFSVNIYPKCGTFKVFIVLFDLKFLKKLAKMEAVD